MYFSDILYAIDVLCSTRSDIDILWRTYVTDVQENYVRHGYSSLLSGFDQK